MRIALLGLAMALAASPLRAQAPPSPAPPSPAPPSPAPADPPAAQPAEPAPPAEHPVRAGASADGFSIQSESGDYRLLFRGYSQFDGRFYAGAEELLAIDQFLIRRARPILQGTVAKHFELTLTPDFGGGTAVIQDAYLDVRYSHKARVRLGKFKAPVGLERLQSATVITFVERAFPTSLVPNRDVGAQVFGDLGRGVVSYAAGVFNGAVDGGSTDGDTNDGKDFAARVFVSPFKKGSSRLRDLGFGVAGTIGDQAFQLPTYRSGGQLPIVAYLPGVVADGRRTRIVPQLSCYGGPLSLVAEYARNAAFVRGPDGTRTEVRTRAWQATATWTLTGERASYTGLRPRDAFDPAAGHWGAVELGARVNGLEIGDEAFAAGLVDPARSVREALAWGLVVNWYLNRHVKQVVSYERTTFTGGAEDGADRPAENALFIRTQLSF